MKRFSYFITILVLVISALLSCGKRLVPAEVSKGKIRTYDSATFNYIFVEAVKQKLLGNSGDALKLLEQCIRINPESDASYFQMAQIMMAAGDNINGKKYGLKALSLESRNFWYLMLLAGTYYQEYNLDSAIIFYEQAARYFPEKEDLQLTLGNLYSQNKKYGKANDVFVNLDQKYGVNETSTVETVKNLMRAERYDEALEKAKELLGKYPDEIQYNGLMAEIYRGKGEKEKAIEVYRELMKRNPDNPQTLLSLCDFLLNEKNYDDLFVMLQNVILNEKVTREDKIDLFVRMIGLPDIVKVYGDKLLLSSMLMEASFPEDDIVVLLRPEVFIERGLNDEAASRLEEIIKERPENYYAWEKLLLVYLQKGDYRSLEVKGKECATNFNRSFLAKLLYATGANENRNYDIALEELRKATILAGNNKDYILQVLSLKADVYYRQKNYGQAFKTFDEALTYNNEDLTILNNYAYFLAEQNNRLKEAEAMARKVIEKESKNSTFLDTYAWVLYKRGKLREADKIMYSITNSGEKPDAEWYEHYGYILKKRRDCKNAIVNWNSALKIDSTKKHLIKEIENCQESR
ncbi:MAG: tetratricopeptide repeat protein [Bacteroidales bacterium]|jgi:tetratricopeptide (TPR) repeat protein|nr:tetratricopeptide repeat protein [Bacteroidales bacterium]